MAQGTIFRSELNSLVKLLLKEDALQNFEMVQDLSQVGLIIELPIKVVHKGTGFYFEIVNRSDDFRLEYFPGTEAAVTSRKSAHWNNVLAGCSDWLARVKREIAEPNPWLTLNQSRILANEIPSSGETSTGLTETEIERIREFVRSIREFILSETNPAPEQLKLSNAKLNYLVDSAKRQSKHDWAHTAIGVVFTIAVGLAMAPEQSSKLFQLTSSFLKTLFVKLLVSTN